MRCKYTILQFLFLLITPLSVWGGIQAGPVKISGKVVAEDGSPLPYANVAVKGKMIGTVADNNGKFMLLLSQEQNSYILTASYLGYSSGELSVSVNRPKEITFRLSENMTNLNTVVVTGTRTPKLLKDVPVQTRIITAEEISRKDATNIGDLLQAELPGIEFSYSMNQQVSLNMQGFGGTSVLFLVDGERLAGETLDNIDYLRLNMDNVERIEIVKGAASSLYGSNAVGGVINIITKKAAKPWSVNLNSRYGSHRSWRNGITAGFVSGRFNSITNYQHTHISSYSLGDESMKEESDYTTFYGSHTHSFKERLIYNVSDKVKLIGKAGYFFRERDSQPTNKDRYRDFSGGLKMEYALNEKSALEASYNFDQYDKSGYNIETRKDIRNYSNVQQTGRVLYSRAIAEENTWIVGADFMNDYLMSYQFEGNSSYRMQSADIFTQFDWMVTPNFNLTGGARLDYYSEISGIRLSPKLSMMYKLSNLAFRGSYSGGFRAPTLKEMHMKFDMAGIFDIYGNPDLKSETSHNFMVSAEYMKSRYNFTVSGYYNLVNNRITTMYNSALPGMKYQNNKRIDIAGVDVNFLLKLSIGISTRLSYAYTHEFMRKKQVNTSGTRPHTGTLNIDYGKRFKNYEFNLALSGRYMSSVHTNYLTSSSSFTEYAKVYYSPYSMWKLIATQKIGKPYTLTLTVDNLFNYKPDKFSYNSPTPYGCQFFVGVAVNVDEMF